MDLKPKRKFVSPSHKSTDLQKGVKEGHFKCTKCLKVKTHAEGYRKNYYWCRECHREYTRKRPKKVSYNQLW